MGYLRLLLQYDPKVGPANGGFFTLWFFGFFGFGFCFGCCTTKSLCNRYESRTAKLEKHGGGVECSESCGLRKTPMERIYKPSKPRERKVPECKLCFCNYWWFPPAYILHRKYDVAVVCRLTGIRHQQTWVWVWQMRENVRRSECWSTWPWPWFWPWTRPQIWFHP